MSHCHVLYSSSLMVLGPVLQGVWYKGEVMYEVLPDRI